MKTPFSDTVATYGAIADSLQSRYVSRDDLDLMAPKTPYLPGSTVVLLDTSRSMDMLIEGSAHVTYRALASTLATSLLVRGGPSRVAVIAFADDAFWVPMGEHAPPSSIFAKLMAVNHGTGSNVVRAMEKACTDGGAFQRVVIISDVQWLSPAPSEGSPLMAHADEFMRHRHVMPKIYSIKICGDDTASYDHEGTAMAVDSVAWEVLALLGKLPGDEVK